MKINLLLVVAFLSIVIYANINEMHGIIGLTKRDGGLGCLCHNLTSTDSVSVWIEGPDSVLRNSSVQYRLFMTGGPDVAGGFNIASFVGTLDSVDTLTQVLFGELTHTSPNPFFNDTVSWNFLYTAPDSLLIDTLYSVANSVNWDSIPSNLDQWNFGANFLINIIDNPVSTGKENLHPERFVLYQNYPNPFNLGTIIQYAVSNRQFITLKVYDILGNEVATLVNEELLPGEYESEFNGDGLASGIYLYKLETQNMSQVMKMVLLR